MQKSLSVFLVKARAEQVPVRFVTKTVELRGSQMYTVRDKFVSRISHKR